MPRKLLTSVSYLGVGHSRTDFVFSGSILTPPEPMMCPKDPHPEFSVWALVLTQSMTNSLYVFQMLLPGLARKQMSSS